MTFVVILGSAVNGWNAAAIDPNPNRGTIDAVDVPRIRFASMAVPRWLPRYECAPASPAMIGALMASELRPHATATLPAIEQLVLDLADDRVISAAFGRMLAQRLKQVRYVERPGDDHFSGANPSIRQHVYAKLGVRSRIELALLRPA